jgi:hypothetical protein
VVHARGAVDGSQRYTAAPPFRQTDRSLRAQRVDARRSTLDASTMREVALDVARRRHVASPN